MDQQLQDVLTALRNAEEAGRTDDARRLAEIANQLVQSQEARAPQERSTGQELMRQLGLTARAGVTGAMALPSLIGDPLNQLVNMIAGTNLPSVSGATQQLLTQAGVPQPENRTERIVGDIASGVASVAAPAGLATRLARTPPTRGDLAASAPTVRVEPTLAAPATRAEQVQRSLQTGGEAVRRLVTQDVGSQAAAVTGASLLSSLARESGLGPVAQAVGGLIGGVAAPGAAQVAGGRIAETVKPFTEAGREVIGGRVLRELSTEPDLAALRAGSYEATIPGYTPTTAQATRDIGLIAAEGPIRALDTTGKFAAQQSQANKARMNILDRLAKDEQALANAIAKRDEVTKPLRENAFARATTTPETFQSAVALTANKTIDEILASPAGARGTVAKAMQFAKEQLARGTDPQRLYEVRKDLRDASQGLLDREGAAFSLASKQLNQVIRSVDDVLESSAPGYKEYLSKYAQASKGIDSLEAAQTFRNKVMTTTPDPMNLGDYLISQPSFTRAIRSIEADPAASNLSKTQIALLKKVSQDLDDGVLIRATKQPGSDTFKNISTANVIGSIIGKQTFGETSPLLSKVSAPLNWLYNGTDDKIRELIVDAMLDPKLASRLMQRASVATVEPVSQELQRRAISLGYGSIFGLE
jgi:hypothetical protein